MVEDGVLQKSDGLGTPQGGVISPLLANIYLHSFETGFSIEQNTLRYYEVFPVSLAIYKNSRTLEERYYAGIGRYYGYDLFGKKELDNSKFHEINGNEFEEAGAKKPIKFGLYIQDKFTYGKFSEFMYPEYCVSSTAPLVIFIFIANPKITICESKICSS